MKNAWVLVAAAAVLFGCGGDVCVGERLPDGGCAASDGSSGQMDSAVALCGSDRDCSDDRFCTGVERCDPAAATDPSGCIPGDPPCQMSGVTCVVAAARCVTDCGTSADADGDGHDSTDCGGDDCDDTRGDVYPGTIEVCDAEGVDEDCVPETLGPDRDGDGYPSNECCYQAPGAPDRVCGGDCDDDDPARSPDASEICNGIDDDCDGNIDEGLPSAAFYKDEDGDGYGTGEPRVLCGPDALYTAPRGGDCDDGDPTINPGQAEICNGRDDDCDPSTWAPGEDDDGDGFADADCGGDDCYDDNPGAGPSACDVIAITAGFGHTCVLHGSGEVWCWGMNNKGQVGAGISNENVTVPARVTGLPSAVSVSAGHEFTCAVASDGDVYCWGANDSAQLGMGMADGDAHRAPQRSPLLASVTAIEAGDGHVCAATSTATHCWGANVAGQIGNGAASSHVAIPFAHSMIVSPARIALGGGHSCVLLRGTNGLMCWGANGFGQLGTGATAGALSPRIIVRDGVSYKFDDLTAGLYHSCGVDDGVAECWGRNNYGQLGRGGTTDFHRPGGVPSLNGVVHVASSRYHTCAARADGTVACWGLGTNGQLGDGHRTTRLLPVNVGGLTNVIQLAPGAYHTCALRSTGEVLCWGRGAEGQLGSSSIMESNTPIPVDR